MNKESHTSFGVMWGDTTLRLAWEADFDLRDLLKPDLSPALPHWKWTRVSAGQLDHNKTIASTLTLQASLITSTTALEMDKSIGRANFRYVNGRCHFRDT